MSICLAALIAVAEIGGQPAKGILLTVPVPFSDPAHPRPAWVDGLASEPPGAIEAKFHGLDLERQVEFAVFMQIDQHPEDLRWTFEVAERGEALLPLLDRLIAAEKGDLFALGLMEIVHAVAIHSGLSQHREIWTTMHSRVRLISNETVKWNGEDLIERISKEEGKLVRGQGELDLGFFAVTLPRGAYAWKARDNFEVVTVVVTDESSGKDLLSIVTGGDAGAIPCDGKKIRIDDMDGIDYPCAARGRGSQRTVTVDVPVAATLPNPDPYRTHILDSYFEYKDLTSDEARVADAMIASVRRKPAPDGGPFR